MVFAWFSHGFQSYSTRLQLFFIPQPPGGPDSPKSPSLSMINDLKWQTRHGRYAAPEPPDSRGLTKQGHRTSPWNNDFYPPVSVSVPKTSSVSEIDPPLCCTIGFSSISSIYFVCKLWCAPWHSNSFYCVPQTLLVHSSSSVGYTAHRSGDALTRETLCPGWWGVGHCYRAVGSPKKYQLGTRKLIKCRLFESNAWEIIMVQTHPYMFICTYVHNCVYIYI